ncbi:hypothetical protein BH11ACT5_BH11ACT5_18480 [soil metagenome]
MWAMKPHTKAKHQMLDTYLKGWYPRLAKFNGRVLYFDGFAGRGKYEDGSIGSPLIALQLLLQHTYLPNMAHRDFVFIFVEAVPENAESLRNELASFEAEIGGYPSYVKVHVVETTFEDSARSLAAQLRSEKKQLAPTFALIDPFGYSGLPMDVIAELFEAQRSEVFVNFMVGHVMRFIERDGQEEAISGLFGMDSKDVMSGYKPGDDKRVEYLRDVYCQQLKAKAGFEYVRSFAMKNSSGNVSYYLVHGTRHREGVKLMKAAMWKVDPGNGAMFSDRLAGEDVLFEPTPNLYPLEAELLKKFSGTRVLVESIEWHTILETPYRETHVRPVLTPLEKRGVIKVERPGRSGFPADRTHVTFP